jgi:hypothetical protein
MDHQSTTGVVRFQPPWLEQLTYTATPATPSAVLGSLPQHVIPPIVQQSVLPSLVIEISSDSDLGDNSDDLRDDRRSVKARKKHGKERLMCSKSNPIFLQCCGRIARIGQCKHCTIIEFYDPNTYNHAVVVAGTRKALPSLAGFLNPHTLAAVFGMVGEDSGDDTLVAFKN